MCPFKNHRLHCALFLTLSLVWLGTSTAEELAMASQDSPQWRGPNRDGVSSETGRDGTGVMIAVCFWLIN